MCNGISLCFCFLAFREVEYERPSLSPFSFSEKSFAFVSKYYVDHSGTNNSKVYA